MFYSLTRVQTVRMEGVALLLLLATSCLAQHLQEDILQVGGRRGRSSGVQDIFGPARPNGYIGNRQTKPRKPSGSVSPSESEAWGDVLSLLALDPEACQDTVARVWEGGECGLAGWAGVCALAGL